jgi:hypothetical protein
VIFTPLVERHIDSLHEYIAMQVDLKIRPFSHRDAGQINFYLN